MRANLGEQGASTKLDSRASCPATISQSNTVRIHSLAALPLLALSLPAQGIPEAVEPNDTVATAGVIAPGAQAYGSVDTSGTDNDWYAFTLASASDLRMWTSPGFVGPIGDTRLALRDSAGTLIVEIDDGNTTTHGYYSILTVTNVPAGSYFLSVRG